MKHKSTAQFAAKNNRQYRGFTLAELLMGLMIAAIVLGAAATMAEAMSNGKRETENMTRTATYLAQLNARLCDLVMRAESIGGQKDDVLLTFNNGQRTARIYTDDSKRIIVEQSDNAGQSYMYLYKTFNEAAGQLKAAQSEVHIHPDLNAVTIALTVDNQAYILTATRRGGQ